MLGAPACRPISVSRRLMIVTAVSRTCTGFSDASAANFRAITIGNILGAQFFAAARKAHPDISSEIANGQFGTLRGWLTNNIYRHGRTLRSDEIVVRATGSPMTMAPYLAYLRGKYGELYQLPAALEMPQDVAGLPPRS